MKLHLPVVFVLLTAVYTTHAQQVSSLGSGLVVELEAVESPITGAFVAAVMERQGVAFKVFIYRSEDKGVNWSVRDSIVSGPLDDGIADPVIGVDSLGNMYLVVMRVRDAISPEDTEIDLELYFSADDGISWEFRSSPHRDGDIADYPQLEIGHDGDLFLVYSIIRGFPIIQQSALTFRRSVDGGLTWEQRRQLGSDELSSIGADLVTGPGNELIVTTGARSTGEVYLFRSFDKGATWTAPDTVILPGQERAHITKPVSGPDSAQFNMISHMPHMDNAHIVLHSPIGINMNSSVIDSGAYAQGLYDANGVLHLVYNTLRQGDFNLMYTHSSDHGLSLSPPQVIYSGEFSATGTGEYQSLFKASDGNLYIIFSDWSDNGKAKTLVFTPTVSLPDIKRDAVIRVYPNPASEQITISSQNFNNAIEVRILDTNGRQHVRMPVGGQQTITLRIGDLPSGIYVVLVKELNRYLTCTLVID